MSESEDVKEDSLKVSFTLRGSSVSSFKKACETSGLRACDFAKSATVFEMRKWMKTHDFQKPQVSRTGDLPHVRAPRVDMKLSKLNLSQSDLRTNFFRTFTAKIYESEVEKDVDIQWERISKTIKDKWSVISESGISADEMAQKYLDYLVAKKSADSKPLYPNTWLRDQMWRNKTSAGQSGEPEPHLL